MQPLLFDASVWINYLKGVKDSRANLLHQYVENEKPVLLCPIIVQEVLQGIKNNSDFEITKSSLLSFTVLRYNSIDAAIGSAQLYRSLRKNGITINKSNDCMIAFYAIHFGVELVHSDPDFDKIAKYSALKIYKP